MVSTVKNEITISGSRVHKYVKERIREKFTCLRISIIKPSPPDTCLDVISRRVHGKHKIRNSVSEKANASTQVTSGG